MYGVTCRNEWGEERREAAKPRGRKYSELSRMSGELGGRDNYDSYTFEVVVSKVESSTVRFELKTMSSFGEFVEPAVYELFSLEAALKLLTYDGLVFPDPTTVVLLRSWRRMIIMQKEIPRTGLVYVVEVRS